MIDGTSTETPAKLHEKIKKAVNKISIGKRLVLIDGVGYAAVGSVAQCSNANIAQLFNAPVMIVGRAGVGNAIDATNFIFTYFKAFGLKVLGAVW